MNKPSRLLSGHPYTPSHSTNIRKLFQRVKKELAEQKRAEPKVVTPIRSKKG